MKNYKLLVLGLLFGSLLACTDQRPTAVDRANILADSLKQLMGPDSRTVLISLTAENQNKALIIKGETTHPDFEQKYFNALEEAGIVFTDSLITLPAEDLGDLTMALVNVSVANLRGKPGHSQEQVTQVVMGTPVKVFKKQGGWYFIQTPENYLAWVDEAAISLLSPDQLSDWKTSDRVLFTGDFAVVRQEADRSAPAVSDVVLGAILTRIGEKGKWTQVALPDQRSGFLETGSLMTFSDWLMTVGPSADRFEEMGFNLLGRPYLWGGTSVKGMDCSGFTKTLYATGGLILDRDASQQVNMGEAVGFDNLTKGDLLFWGRKAGDDQKERITHVGMYLGDGKYIHCSGRVKINSFSPSDPEYSEYLVTIFVRARRIIQPELTTYACSFRNHPWYH